MKKILFITIIFCLENGLMSCKHQPPKTDPAAVPISVNVTEVKQEVVHFYDSYPATVIALKEVELRSQVEGFITGIFFNDAQPVKMGQKLYEIDRTKYQANFQVAKNNLSIARSNLEKARRDADRYTDLNNQEAIARQKYEDALTDLDNVKMQVTSAEAELKKAETDLGYSIIKAPFNGTIGISLVKMGTLVNSGQTLLNIISSDDPIGIDFVIEQKELTRFQQLEGKKVEKNDSTFRIILPDNSIYPYNGKISLIDRAVDPQTGTVKVRLICSNAGRTLKSGLNCNVNVIDESAGKQLLIPFKAVVEQMSEYFVFVTDGNQVKQTKINLGTKIGSMVIVNSGLKSGDLIVTDGVQKLRDGSSILTEKTGGTPPNAKTIN